MYFLEIDGDRVLRVDEEGGHVDDERRLHLLLGGEPSEVFRVPGWGLRVPAWDDTPATGDVIGYARANAPRAPCTAPFSVYVRVGDVEAPVYGLLVVVARNAAGRLRDLTYDEADGFRLDKRTRTPILWMPPHLGADQGPGAGS